LHFGPGFEWKIYVFVLLGLLLGGVLLFGLCRNSSTPDRVLRFVAIHLWFHIPSPREEANRSKQAFRLLRQLRPLCGLMCKPEEEAQGWLLDAAQQQKSIRPGFHLQQAPYCHQVCGDGSSYLLLKSFPRFVSLVSICIDRLKVCLVLR
jgi:hypothetical protein